MDKQKSSPAPVETRPGHQMDDNVDDLGHKGEKEMQDQPIDRRLPNPAVCDGFMQSPDAQGVDIVLGQLSKASRADTDRCWDDLAHRDVLLTDLMRKAMGFGRELRSAVAELPWSYCPRRPHGFGR